MEDDLNKLFKEIERQEIDMTCYARQRHNGVYEVEISLSLRDPNGGNNLASVSGKGPRMQDALRDAYYRLMQMANALAWQPTPSPISGDDIPF